MSASSHPADERTPDDAMIGVIAELAAELWVVKRRLGKLESELAERGLSLDLDGEAAPSTPDEVAARDEFVARVFGPLLATSTTPDER